MNWCGRRLLGIHGGLLKSIPMLIIPNNFIKLIFLGTLHLKHVSPTTKSSNSNNLIKHISLIDLAPSSKELSHKPIQFSRRYNNPKSSIPTQLILAMRIPSFLHLTTKKKVGSSRVHSMRLKTATEK